MRPDVPFRHLTLSRQLLRRRRRNRKSETRGNHEESGEKKWEKASWKTDEGVNERKRREVFFSAALSRERKPRGFKLAVSFKIVSSRELVRSIRSIHSFLVVVGGFFGQRAKELVPYQGGSIGRICKDNLSLFKDFFYRVASAMLTCQRVPHDDLLYIFVDAQQVYLSIFKEDFATLKSLLRRLRTIRGIVNVLHETHIGY